MVVVVVVVVVVVRGSFERGSRYTQRSNSLRPFWISAGDISRHSVLLEH